MSTERVVSKKHLSALIREGVSTRDRTASISGTFRERIGDAVENGHLNRKAFNIALGLAKMKDEVARDRAIRDLPLYIDMLREEGVFPAEHVGDLVDDAEKAAAGEDGPSGFVFTGTADAAIKAMDAALKAEAGEGYPKTLRPLCLNPDNCSGYGRTTCHSCLTAADERDPVAAAADAAFSAEDGVEPAAPKTSRKHRAAMGDAPSSYTLKH